MPTELRTRTLEITLPTVSSGLSAVNGNPARIVCRRTARKALHSGVLWGCVFAAYVASQALAYASTYKTAAARQALSKSFTTSGGLNAVVGPAHDLGTVTGYTAWKSLGILSVLGAVWALLLSTKLMRGEEDAGRWELLLAGQTTRRRAAAQALSGLGIGLFALIILTAIGTVIIGHTSRVHFTTSAGIFFAMSVTSGAAMFMAAGALASQLAASRRQAAACCGGALGLFFALRMVADASSSLSWLHWLTPLGWVEQLQPFTNPQPLVLVLIYALAGVLAAGAIALAGRRDLGSSLLPDRSSATASTTLLGGPIGLTMRLIRPTVIGWLAGVCAFGLLLGSSAKVASQSLKSSPSVEAALNRLSGGSGLAKTYLGVSFLLITLLVVLIAAGQITSARHEESSGRVEHILVRPVSRASWMLGRLAVAAGVVMLAGLLGGVFSWLGAAAQHTGLSFTNMLGAGLNTVPAGICLLGIGALVWAVFPRLASAGVYAVLAWSFLVELLGGIVNSSHWLLDTSILHQLAPAPATAPDWGSNGALLAFGLVASLVAAIIFNRRDLAGE
jgi:polyether ionophore transport system permease protein